MTDAGRADGQRLVPARHRALPPPAEHRGKADTPGPAPAALCRGPVGEELPQRRSPAPRSRSAEHSHTPSPPHRARPARPAAPEARWQTPLSRVPSARSPPAAGTHRPQRLTPHAAAAQRGGPRRAPRAANARPAAPPPQALPLRGLWRGSSPWGPAAAVGKRPPPRQRCRPPRPGTAPRRRHRLPSGPCAEWSKLLTGVQRNQSERATPGPAGQ